MQKMEIFRLRVLEQIINEKFDFYDKIVEKTDFLDYFKNESLKHNKKWIYVYQHFAAFTNNKCTFADINVALCQRFRSYLLNTAKLRDDSKKLKQNSAAGYFSTFRGILKEAYKKRMLKENINDFLDRIPEEETEINYLTEHELGLIINNECPIPVLRKAIIFACITGFRRSDILALKWGRISRNCQKADGVYSNVCRKQRTWQTFLLGTISWKLSAHVVKDSYLTDLPHIC